MRSDKFKLSLSVILAILAIFSSSILATLNPGLYWDDWLWINKNASELQEVGLQMGVWWSGYLSAILYGLENPVITLRLISFFGWIISAYVISKIAYKLKLLTAIDSYFFFLIYANCHFGLIRFFPSVAIYTLYIASFWVAIYIFISFKKNKFLILVSYFLFIFSFHLNSILLIFILFIVIIILVDEKIPLINFFKNKEFIILENNKKILVKFLKAALKNRSALFFLSAPVFFYLIIILPSKLQLDQSSVINLYASYNKISISNSFYSVIQSFKSSFSLIHDYFYLIKSKNTLLILFFSFLVYSSLSFFIFFKINIKNLNIFSVIRQFSYGLFFIFVAVFPYHLVNKPPLPFDLYESRHTLLALPGIIIAIIAISNIIFLITKKINPKFGFSLKIIFLTVVLSISTTNSINFGMNLARDWLKQSNLIKYISDRKDKLKDYGVIVFDDKTSGLNIYNRYIYHYEYTGLLIRSTDSEDHLGISLSEYLKSSVNSPIFTNQYYKDFYNMSNLDISKPFLVIETTNSNERIKTIDLLSALYRHWISNGQAVESILNITTIKSATEFHEADNIIRKVKLIQSALEKYKLSNGSYPASISGYSEEPSKSNFISFGVFLHSKDVLERNLIPKYLAKGFFDERCNEFRKKCDFLYLSNGTDYKLVYESPSDLNYARQAFPSFVDKNGRYGVWTPDASKW